MNYRINIFFVLTFTLFSYKETTETKTPLQATDTLGYHSTKHLIEAKEFQSILLDEQTKVIDFRKDEEYEKAHILNALNLCRPHIEDKTYPYKGIMAVKHTLEKVISNLRIHESDIIIIYDNKGLSDAARLWWVLKTHNFENVKLLNGGLSAWKKIKGEISSEIPEIKLSKFKFLRNASKDFYIDKNQLIILLNKEDLFLLDARTVDEYSGKRQKSEAARSGRIPKSVNIDWMQAIESKTTQKFKSRAALEKIYAVAGIEKDNPIITYCHTGVRSAHTTFVLSELLGYTDVKNYDGSWSEWSCYEDLPIEKDSVMTVLN